MTIDAELARGENSPPPLTRDQRRSRRKRAERAKTISVRRLSKADRATWAELYPEDGHTLPSCRAECVSIPRPCPFVSCRWHLFLDVSRTGSIKLNFPDLEPKDMAESCALDVAELGGASLEQIAELLNVTRERVRQIEEHAFAKIRWPLRRALDLQFGEAPEFAEVVGL